MESPPFCMSLLVKLCLVSLLKSYLCIEKSCCTADDICRGNSLKKILNIVCDFRDEGYSAIIAR